MTILHNNRDIHVTFDEVLNSTFLPCSLTSGPTLTYRGLPCRQHWGKWWWRVSHQHAGFRTFRGTATSESQLWPLSSWTRVRPAYKQVFLLDHWCCILIWQCKWPWALLSTVNTYLTTYSHGVISWKVLHYIQQHNYMQHIHMVWFHKRCCAVNCEDELNNNPVGPLTAVTWSPSHSMWIVWTLIASYRPITV